MTVLLTAQSRCRMGVIRREKPLPTLFHNDVIFLLTLLVKRAGLSHGTVSMRVMQNGIG